MNKTQFEKSVNPKKPCYQKKTFIWYDIKNFRKGIINCLFFFVLCHNNDVITFFFFFLPEITVFEFKIKHTDKTFFKHTCNLQ